MDIVLYVGLCNGACWVTQINDRDVILLGIEKILELNSCSYDHIIGLVYHELGHVYHLKYGCFNKESLDSKKKYVWQLFTEGIAMTFEQLLLNDLNYYHHDINGWKDWCDQHYQEILADFHQDLNHITRSNQRYFGDWVSYRGYVDVGYYLGTRFIHELMN